MKTAWMGVSALALMASGALASAQDDQTLLLRHPAVSGNTLAFVYAGDLWVSALDGSDPRRLTSAPSEERGPHISPDGRYIAFTGTYESNTDAYVISIDGGQPRRLTWHPGADEIHGWTADGRVLFSSRRETNHGRSSTLWSIAPGEGYPSEVMDARFYRGDMHQDGRLAYLPNRVAYNALYGGAAGWRQYRGGATGTIRVLSADQSESRLFESDRINDINPIWVGDEIYFLSDRDDVSLALHRLDPNTGAIEALYSEAPWDIRWMDSDGQTLVFEAGGRIKRYDVTTGQVSEIRVSLNPDLPQLAPRWESAGGAIQSAAISPTGQRALFTGRGDVFTVPLDEGSTRNITATQGVREYSALWSPDGEQIAYISDEGGVQSLRIVDQRGHNDARVLALGGDDEAFYFLAHWVPGNRRILYTDNHLNLYQIDVVSGESRRIATHARRAGFDLATSPDGVWLAYTLERPNYLQDLVLRNLETGQEVVLSDGMADTSSPAFSADGAYVYFAASTNVGPQQVGLNMNTREKPSRYGIYAVVLAADGRSPLLPGAGDETADDSSEESDEDNTETRIDIAGLSDRIVALPVSERAYGNLEAGEDGALYYMDYTQPGAENTPPGQSSAAGNRLMRFDFEEREAQSVQSGVNGFILAADRETALFNMANGGGWRHGKLGESLDLEGVSTSDMRLRVDPRLEWAHIFDEVWRMERAYFYDANLQGLDWDGVKARYEPLLDHVGRREDLNALMQEMIGEMQAGHNNVGGGDVHRDAPVSTGLLGADFETASNRYRIAKIYNGENWNPFLRGPLAAPGLGVSEGDFILAINGEDLTASDNIFSRLQGLSGEQVTLTVAATANGENRRDIVVETISNEGGLRLWDWVEGNRRYVDEQTNGQVGYVYLPNTAGAGYDLFNRMYYAQANRDAIIFDERSNSGGQAADYITDVLSPFHLSGWRDRDGLAFNTPAGAHYGPKVMLIDQDAGSGGDYLPYSFRRRGVGPLIGTRTWGGLIGISANPSLIDGGFLTVPFFRFYTPEGEWTIENEGVAPDIEVQLDPVLYNQGQDSQLDRAIAETQRLLDQADGPSVPLTLPDPPAEPGL